MIYFDNAATSFKKPIQVKNTITLAINKLTANPGRSGHKLSQQVAEIVFDTREKLKQFFNAENYDVVFTKNCTEALNLAIFGSLKAGDHVITTCFEHNSVLRPLEKLKSNGVEVDVVFCEKDNLTFEIEKFIKSNTKMIITTACSNVTGECIDINEVSKLAHKHNLLYLVDGAQSSGHIDIDLTKTNIDLYAFAGHTGLLASTGVGGLLIKKGITIQPMLCGGTGTDSENLIQPNDIPEGLEAGTIPTLPIISLNAGISFLLKNFQNIKKIEENLSNYLYNQLKNLKFLKIYSKTDSKNVFSFNIEGYDSALIANILNDEFGICVRSGLHCAPLIHKKLNTIETGAVRVSLDFFNTKQEIDELINALIKIYKM